MREFRHAQLAWTLSQFLHGEQGAMITASQLVGAVPWTDGKYYASSQTMDEARHTEVFARYLNEKLEWEWPINPNLKSLLDIVLTDSRWDLKFLGMQIVVEGLAMAAFANMYMMAQEPLLKELLKNVMRDESRHVAFGVLSLRGYYDDMPANELKDREEFLMEACTLMRDRLVGEDVSEHFGFDKEEVRKIVLESPVMQEFR
ncbi:MAG: ferritin-like domain-containing protein, partial [Deltaproteobacteria bacterium]|nr:ferritin-like domain-containing protein [Deltaproteobacteria bacterium]